MKRILFVILAVLCLAACSEKKPESQRILVMYYSQEGTTREVAEILSRMLKADLQEIEAKQPYDGDFQATIERCRIEKAAGAIPAIKYLAKNPKDYDVIFLGYPIWFGTYATPIEGLLNQHAADFKGKKVVTFCSFGSGGLQSSTANLRNALPEANVVEGYGVRAVRREAIPHELHRFLVEAGYMKGDFDPLPAFMEHHPVTAEESFIFHDACDGYQFPLGTPVSVASRTTPDGTEYEFTASQGENAPEATVYVIMDANGKSEFTQVVR